MTNGVIKTDEIDRARAGQVVVVPLSGGYAAVLLRVRRGLQLTIRRETDTIKPTGATGEGEATTGSP